ncbi:hypothetical protein GE21DRAFT_1052480 [Neurospora crassa]|nr:hypothetical protein GE21DRAFT_1052480 [Neurospora crassa]
MCFIRKIDADQSTASKHGQPHLSPRPAHSRYRPRRTPLRRRYRTFLSTMHTISQPAVVPLPTFFCFPPPVFALVLLHLLASSLRVINILSRRVVGVVTGGKLEFTTAKFCFPIFHFCIVHNLVDFLESAYTDGLVGKDSEDMLRWTGNSFNTRHGRLKWHRVALEEICLTAENIAVFNR